MNKQTVLWTTLPFAATTANTLQLSVVLSPRLWSDEAAKFQTLANFPDWLDLPQRIRDAAFTVEFENTAKIAATRAPLDPDQADEPESVLWQALFNPNTIVLPFKFSDYSTRHMQSYSARAIADYLQNLYTRVGVEASFGAGGEYPALAALAKDDALRAIETPEHRTSRKRRSSEEETAKQAEQKKHDQAFGDRKREFDNWVATRGNPTDREKEQLEKERDNIPTESPSAPKSYEYVLERDSFKELDDPTPVHPPAAVPPEDAPFSPQMDEWANQFGRLHRFHEPHSKNVLPLTQGELVTKLKDNTISDAELAQVIDFHRAIALLADYPRLLRRMGLVIDLTIQRNAQIPASGTVRVVARWDSTLPTLNYSARTEYRLDAAHFFASPKTNGLSRGLIHMGNAGFVTAQIDVDGAAFKLSNLAGDLQDALTNPAAAPTSSLPALRSGGIALLQANPSNSLQDKFTGSKQLNDLVDAQQASLSATTTSMQNAPHPQNLDVISAESLVRGYRVDVFDDKKGRWLSLHRRDGEYRFTNPDPDLTLNLSDEGFARLSATTAADGLQPDLYVHEALAVWQGWSLAAPLHGKAIANAKERGQGNSAPQPAQPAKPDLADSNYNPAQTDFGLETTFTPSASSLPRLRFGHTYRLRVRATDLAGNSVPLDPNDTQPNIAEATNAAMYRRFEPVSQPFLISPTSFEKSAGESLERLVIRTRPGVTTGTSERHVVPPKTAQLTAELHQMFDGAARLKRDQAGYELAKREAAGLSEVEPTASITVPYLPDPLARGALLLGLPGLGVREVEIDFNKLPFTGEYPDLKSFRILLEDGNGAPRWDRLKRVLTIGLPAGDTARVRLSSYVNPDDLSLLGVWDWILASNPPNLAALKQQAQDGRHWMLTPYRTLSLVHAVAQPLTAPKFDSLSGNRVEVGKSLAIISGKVNVDRKSTAHADIVAQWQDPNDDPNNPNNDPAVDVSNNQANVGDPVAIPFTDHPLDDLGVLKPSADPVPFNLRHEFQDTKYHHVTYRATATTRFRDYFVDEVACGLKITRKMENADAISVHIDSSTRPAAPRVAYIVPTFQSRVAPGIIERRGAGLRVYLERPWFSSGAGELLGVVFQSRPFKDLSPLAQPRVTQWASDPFWKALHPPPQVEYGHFEGYTYPEDITTSRIWTLDEMSEPVLVAAFPVHFDAARKLWFSDIRLNLGNTYFPFVRLALARCQPHSLKGVELSRVTLADFAQVTPWRQLTVTGAEEHDGKIQVSVYLKGPSYDERTSLQDLHDVQVGVQTPIPGIGGDLAWEDVDPNEVEVDTNEVDAWYWSGTVRYPVWYRDARLVITEIERLSPHSRRVIFADVVPVMPS